MKILYTAFKGINNSSKILLDAISCDKNNKLYLKNSFSTSVNQLIKKLKSEHYDLIISFGQAPLKTNEIKIELEGKNGNTYTTNYNYKSLKQALINNKFSVIVSNDAGNYFCNNIYYYGLKYIKDENLDCKMIFIHVPKINNITQLEVLSNLFSKTNL